MPSVTPESMYQDRIAWFYHFQTICFIVFSLFFSFSFKVSQGNDKKLFPKSQDNFKNVLSAHSPIPYSPCNSVSAGLGHLQTFIGKLPGGRDIKEDFNLESLTAKSLPASLKGNLCLCISPFIHLLDSPLFIYLCVCVFIYLFSILLCSLRVHQFGRPLGENHIKSKYIN